MHLFEILDDNLKDNNWEYLYKNGERMSLAESDAKKNFAF